MADIKDIGTIQVIDVVDNPDGTATIHFEVSEEFKNNLMKQMGWEKWSDEEFNKLILETLTRAVKEKPVDRIED